MLRTYLASEDDKVRTFEVMMTKVIIIMMIRMLIFIVSTLLMTQIIV
jgi:hypothetical protein